MLIPATLFLPFLIAATAASVALNVLRGRNRIPAGRYFIAALCGGVAYAASGNLILSALIGAGFLIFQLQSWGHFYTITAGAFVPNRAPSAFEALMLRLTGTTVLTNRALPFALSALIFAVPLLFLSWTAAVFALAFVACYVVAASLNTDISGAEIYAGFLYPTAAAAVVLLPNPWVMPLIRQVLG